MFCRSRLLFPIVTVVVVIAFACPGFGQTFIRGDANDDGIIDTGDAVTILNHIFSGVGVPGPQDRADVNDNEHITLTDALHLTAHLFCAPVPPIPPPFPAPGTDPDNSTRGFGSPQSSYVVRLTPGIVTNTDIEIVVTVDTPEPLTGVNFTLLLDSSLTPQTPAFTSSGGVTPTDVDTVLDGNLFFLSVRSEGCNVQLVPAGNDVSVGSLYFDHNGSLSLCPAMLPITWTPDVSVNGVQRRASLVTPDFEEYHPTVDLPQSFIRGDANADDGVDSADLVTILNHIFNGTPIPAPLDRADVNDNEFVTITDVLLLGAHLFCFPQPPIPPPTTCGLDPDDSMGNFGAVQPNHTVHFSLGPVTSTDIDILISADTPDPLSAIELIVQFDTTLAPQNPTFIPAPGLGLTIFQEEVDGNLYAVSIRNEDCQPLLLPAGNGQPVGRIVFDHNGAVSPCPAALPIVWEPTAVINGLPRRAAMVSSTFEDFHPGHTTSACDTDFIRGDLNGDGLIDTADATYFLQFLYIGGVRPLDCFGDPLLESADANDNEWLTVADLTLITDFLFCGAQAPPAPNGCGPDPNDVQGGFDAVDPNYGATGLIEVTQNRAEVLLQVDAPVPTTKAATLIIEFDPTQLTPLNPLFCAASGVQAVNTIQEGNRISVTVTSAPCQSMPVNDVTGLVHIGRVHFIHNGIPTCPIATVTLVPEHQFANGVTHRATVVDANYQDHHPVMSPIDCEVQLLDFIRGDADGNGIFNGLSDGLFILAFQFQGGPPPPCEDAADADDNGVINGLSDGLYILDHQFQGGPPPPPPYPTCGPDPTGDAACNELGCASYGMCP